MVIAMICAAIGAASVGDSCDPTAYRAFPIVASYCAYSHSELAPVIIDQSGLEILWDDQSGEFIVTINNVTVNDLVTGTTGAGHPSFEGKFTPQGQPTLHGFVITDGSDTYILEIVQPNGLPTRFTITNYTGVDPAVDATQECDCEDRLDLGCLSHHCTDGTACPNHSHKICKWFNTL